jgi:lactate dehydrogenase-like 2-hydroxyacid dehydrogenase
MKPLLLVLIPLLEERKAAVEAVFETIYASDPASRKAMIEREGARVRAVLTNGAIGLTAAEFDALPALEFVAALGAGYEKIDVEAARKRGIEVTNGGGTNAACVADQAFALLLATVRKIPEFDRAVRAGIYRDALPTLPNVSGKKLGILGLGEIGKEIAQRALGFSMEVAYTNRRPRSDVPYRFIDNVHALASWADYLILAAPGGAATHHLVDAKVLAELGSKGYLVNIARGSLVDSAALAEALRNGTIAGAGLDVYETEPLPPTELLDSPNLVISPHIAGFSPEAFLAADARFVENGRRFFAGEKVTHSVLAAA